MLWAWHARGGFIQCRPRGGYPCHQMAAGKHFYVAIVPGDQRFDAKRMAAAIGERQVDLAEREEAEKLTGYQIGGISPFAMKRKLPAVIEESLLALDKIVVNGGRRGVLIEMATEDVVRLLEAKAAGICG